VLAAPDTVLTLRGSLGWAHDWVSNLALTAGFQTLPGASFFVNGAAPAKDNALASAGADPHFGNGVICGPMLPALKSASDPQQS
jgi:uncharacterized protein with beta-barrel porin domain